MDFAGNQKKEKVEKGIEIYIKRFVIGGIFSILNKFLLIVSPSIHSYWEWKGIMNG